MAQFTAEPRTLAPGAADVEHIITLTVTDDRGATGTDTVKVTVEAPFADTVAHAGSDQTVRTGVEAMLDGSGSTKDRRRTLTYAWARTGGTEGATEPTLSNVGAQQPTFTAPMLTGTASVTHIYTLTVTDNQTPTPATDTDTVTITVSPNMAPTADAGLDQTANEEGMGQLYDSASSDSDGVELTFAWVWP